MLYPNNIKKTPNKIVSHSNRGMNLENMINLTNEYYLENDMAIIYKKPTPTQAVKVSYKNKNKIIEKGYFKEKSTLDYNGIYKGRYIDFDAKETTSKTSFPLSNIHKHQFKHIEDVIRHGGISFLIISICSRYFLIKGEDLINFIKTQTRKSITYNFITENGFEIKELYYPRLDYLKIIDKVYFKKGDNSEEN